jgi:hypothetical protein
MAGLDSNVKLLCHFNGTDGQTTTIDSSEYEHVITAGNSLVQLDTAYSKFTSQSSSVHDGSTYEQGTRWEVADSTDWDFFIDNYQPFTIDLWIRFADVSPSGSNHGFVGQIAGAGTNEWAFWWRQSNKQLNFTAFKSFANQQWAATWEPSAGIWYHVAVVRDSSNNRYLFIDGVELTLNVDTSQTAWSSGLSAPLELGGFATAGNWAITKGNIEELRISDVARWVAGFTPPTAEYAEPGAPIIAAPSPLAGVLALPVPTIDIISNILLTPAPIALGITPEDTAHVNSNVARPYAANMGIYTPDPVVEFGQEVPASQLSIPMNVWSPTIVLLTQTIVELETLAMSATAEEAVGTPDYDYTDITLPMFTLNASIEAAGFEASVSLPMLESSAECVVGHIGSGANNPLPMFTLNAQAGLSVELSLPLLTLVGVGTASDVSTLAKPLPLITLSAVGSSTNRITFDTPLPLITINAVFALGGIHAVAATLPVIRLSAEGTSGSAAGVLATYLPLVTLSGAGYSDGSGTLSKTLPIMTLDAFGTSYISRII